MRSLIQHIKWPLYILTFIAVVYGVIVAKQLLYPIAFGVLFAYLLYPPVSFLEKKGFPRILAILTAILLAITLLLVVFLFFYRQLTHMFNNLETLKQNANENIEFLYRYIQDLFDLKDKRMEEFLKSNVNNFFSSENSGLQKIFSATTGTIFRLIILPVYVFLFLYYRTKFAYFILKIIRRKHKPTAINVLRDISTVAARYMGGVSIVVLILCVLNSSGLLIIGVKYAIVLGIISALFNFIPYFGTLMGGAIPLIFVLLTSNEPGYLGVRVFILFVIIQFIENNILTPNIVGGYVKINPYFIILGLVVGATCWGIPGMLVVVPFLAIARILFKHVDRLKPFAFLLGPKGTSKHSITMNKIKRIFYFRKDED